MNTFADTNWLEALYFEPERQDKVGQGRRAIVQRRMKNHSGPLIISHVVLLEARNVFGRLSGSPNPEQWQHLVSDFNGRIFVDTMNWDLLRRQTHQIFERFSHKAAIGTFDATLIASAQLAGGRRILSFDERLKAIATCLGLEVFPELASDGKAFLSQLKA